MIATTPGRSAACAPVNRDPVSRTTLSVSSPTVEKRTPCSGRARWRAGQSKSLGSRDVFRSQTRSNQSREWGAVAAGLPRLHLHRHRHDRQGGEPRELLALSRLRRDLDACSTAAACTSTVALVIAPTIEGATDHARIVRELRELVAALDRRVPRVHRLGEVAIRRAADTLRAEALKRIEELEGLHPPTR